jgi:hypothetical protein
MREIKLSDAGHKKLRHHTSQAGKSNLLAPRKKIDEARNKLEEGMEYIIDKDVVRLQDLRRSIEKRTRSLDENVDKTALLSVDKGQGRVLVTVSFPYRHVLYPGLYPEFKA